MTAQHDSDRQIKSLFMESASEAQPAGLLETILSTTGSRRSRPAWVVAVRRGGMRPAARVAGQPLGRFAYAIVIAGLVVALVAGLLFVAGGLRRPAPPFGPAANGLIAFSRSLTGADGAIFVADPDGTDPRPIVTTVPGAHQPAFSPDGTKLAFWAGPWSDDPATKAAGTWHLMVSDPEGRRIVDVSRDLTTSQDPGVAEPMINRVSWSPDSEALVYWLPGLGRSIKLVVAAADGSGAHLVGQASAGRFGPAWSPDGRWIAFVEDPVAFTLHVIHPDGTGERRLSTSFDAKGGLSAEGGVAVQWAPDANLERLLYSGSPAHGDIATYDVMTDRETIVSADPQDELWQTWSPDASRIAWYWSNGGPDEIRIADADGKNRRTVYRATDALGNLIQTETRPGPWPGLGHIPDCSTAPEALDRWFRWPPAFSPDGRKLIGFTPCHTAFLVVTVDGSQSASSVSIGTSRNWVSSWQRLAP